MTNSETTPQNEILESLRAIRKNYAMNPEAKLRNTGKRTLMLVGASGTGKSTIADAVIAMRPDIKPIATRTTRARRPEDPDTFITADEGFTHARALTLAQEGEFVNFSPFGSHVYSTTPEDFAEFSIGPITADSVPLILEGGFTHTSVVYPTIDATVFQATLENERMGFKDIAYRLKEGIESTEFALMSVDQPWFHAVENSHENGGLERAGKQVIAIGEGGAAGLDTRMARRALIAMRSVLMDLREEL